MFNFADFWIILLLPLPWLIRHILPTAKAYTQSALVVPFFQRFEAITQQKRMSGKYLSTRRFIMYTIWVLVIIAAAGPQWLGKPYEVARAGRNIMLALDISGSMQIPDMELNNKPTERLNVVKQVAKDFVNQREGDQVGLILFGSRAYVQTPLTFDLRTVDNMISDASIGLAGQQTALGDAMGLAIKRLSKLPQKSRVVILLTDGANNSGTVDPIQTANLAAQEGIKIYTIGLGADRMLVPGLLGPQVVNPSASLDEDALKKIAEITGGKFFRAKNSQALMQIYDAIDSLEPSSGKASLFRPVTDYYFWPLGAALFLAFFMAITRLRLPLRQTSNDVRGELSC